MAKATGWKPEFTSKPELEIKLENWGVALDAATKLGWCSTPMPLMPTANISARSISTTARVIFNPTTEQSLQYTAAHLREIADQMDSLNANAKAAGKSGN